MQSIEDKALETYTKNIEYLSSHHKDLMKLLTTLELAINKGDYQERFDLEYNDGYFDIKNLSNNAYIYGGNSTIISKELTKLVNLHKDNRAFEGFPIYNFTEDAIKNATGMTKMMKGIYPIMQYYHANSKMNDSMKAIRKFIFAGVKLGLHIPMIHKKIKAQEYLIIEDDLEVFKLSLFTTEYFNLAEDATLYFSVADDENLFLTTMKHYLHNTFFENRYLKYLHFPGSSEEKLKQIQNAVMTQSFIFFPYKVVLDKFLTPLEYINDGYNIINLIEILKNDLLKDKPVLVIGAGPSFKNNLEWLKENHGKFVIIAASASLKTLYSISIKPDILTHMDGQELSHEHFENIDSKVFLKDTVILLGSHVSKFVREQFNKEQVFYYEEATYYFNNFSSNSTPCVGSFSLLLSLQLEAKETYLLGLDFAIDQETGATHSSDHVEAQNLDMNEKEKLQKSMDYITNLFPVQGNFTETVYTNGLLHASVQVLYQFIPMLKNPNQMIYNMNNGAKVFGCMPKHIEDVAINSYKKLDKKEVSSQIHILFLEHSKQELSKEDVNSLKMRIENAQEIRNYIEKYETSPVGNNADNYLYNILGVVSFVLKRQGREANNLTQVFLDYFKIFTPITIDLLNTKNLKNEKRHIKKMHKMFVTEMYSICDLYIDTLTTFVQERC